RVGGLEVLGHLHVVLLDLVDVDLLDVNQAQQRLHRAGNVAPAFVARTAALGDADLGPELRLVHAELATDFADVEVVTVLHDDSCIEYAVRVGKTAFLRNYG